MVYFAPDVRRISFLTAPSEVLTTPSDAIPDFFEGRIVKMSWLSAFLNTSIGKKQLMAVTGLSLSGFLVVHLLGNFTLFAGKDAFNEYAHFYASHPKLLMVAEMGLIVLFLLHMGLALKLTLENKAARPVGYVMKRPSEATLASRTMIYSGLLILVFLILHIRGFKFGGAVTDPAHDWKDFYTLVVTSFQKPLVAMIYLISMVILGLHLNHGIQSAVQTFGLEHPKYTMLVKRASTVFALLIAVGFSIIPLYFWLVYKG
jgi:succinate dehydrogenase / fumarate reductase cytochrome b subunit